MTFKDHTMLRVQKMCSSMAVAPVVDSQRYAVNLVRMLSMPFCMQVLLFHVAVLRSSNGIQVNEGD